MIAHQEFRTEHISTPKRKRTQNGNQLKSNACPYARPTSSSKATLNDALCDKHKREQTIEAAPTRHSSQYAQILFSSLRNATTCQRLCKLHHSPAATLQPSFSQTISPTDELSLIIRARRSNSSTHLHTQYRGSSSCRIVIARCLPMMSRSPCSWSSRGVVIGMLRFNF